MSWCFTPSQPLRLYQGERAREREKDKGAGNRGRGREYLTPLPKILNDLTALDVNHISLLYLTYPPLLTVYSSDSIIYVTFLGLLCLGFSLSDRTLVRSVSVFSSAPVALNFVVPQGSVLGPFPFVLYSHPILEIVSYQPLSLSVQRCYQQTVVWVFVVVDVVFQV